MQTIFDVKIKNNKNKSKFISMIIHINIIIIIKSSIGGEINVKND